MRCRVGVKSRPNEREVEWQSAVIGVKNWSVSGPCASRAETQAVENTLARAYGCEAHPGGDNALGAWYVYGSSTHEKRNYF